MFSFLKKRPHEFFTREEKEKILEAIRQTEQSTSGEVRLYIENHCRFVDSIDRAAEIFFGLRMHQTAHRNATLVYVALKDKQLAVFGDEGIYAKTGKGFWNHSVGLMLEHFDHDDYAKGIVDVIYKIGDALSEHFPYEASSDKNELPDDIVFGK